MSTNLNRQFTAQQEAVVSQLTSQFQIDRDGIRFFDNRPEQPWLSAEALMSIARQSGNFSSIEEAFDQYVPGLQQVIHVAILVDKEGRIYKRSAAATMGEKLPNGEVIDEHALAGSRALGAVLTASGFHPLRAASVVAMEKPGAPMRSLADEAASRHTDLKRIHALAEEKGLIKEGEGGFKDMDEYRESLLENVGTRTTPNLDQQQRASVIEALRQLPD